MSLVNFSSSVCNYTTKVVELSAVPGSLATNTYPYVDLEMIPDSGYTLNASNFTYLSNTYVDYVVFMTDGNNLKARVYLKGFTWPTERTDLEVPISGCATKVIPTTTTTTAAFTTTTTTTAAPSCPAVTGYFINKSIIELRGETRVFKVYGQQGATFSYTIIDNDNGFSLDTGTETIPYAGFVNINVIVPLTASARVFDVTITTAEACTLQLQTQPSTFKLYQGIDEQWLGDTFECCEEAGVLLSTYCVGVDQYGTYTDGQCGTTDSLIQTNSVACGYVPPTTTTTTSGPTTTTTAAPCTDCAGDISAISDFSAAVGGTTGTINITGTNISPSSVYTWDPNLITVSLSGSTVTWTTNSNNTCGVAHVRVFANNTAGGNCCNEAEDFYITVTGCTGPTTTTTTTTTAAPTTTPTTTTTTTTTTAAPSNCYAHQVLYSATTTCTGSQMTVYTDNNNFCSSTKIYNSSSACASGGTSYASAGYYTYPSFNTGGNQEYSQWNGTTFTQMCVPGCP